MEKQSDSTDPSTASSFNSIGWIGWFGPIVMAVVGTLLGVCIAALIAVSLAHAHDDRRPDLVPWFNQLSSKKGQCCDGREAMHLRPDKWKTQDGKYVVEVPRTGPDFDRAREGHYFESVWVIVPPDAVLTTPNLDGATMVWPIYGPEGISIRCFMPGTLT